VTEAIRQHVVILDFGSQFTHLITRRVRDLGVYSVVFPCWTSLDQVYEHEKIRREGLIGIILSGGPGSVYEADAPLVPEWAFAAGVPILGICYGMQALASQLGGRQTVRPGTGGGEYGHTLIDRTVGDEDEQSLLRGLPQTTTVWMSHGDQVETLPVGFRSIASSKPCPIAAMEDRARRIYAIQFHPEVTHTPEGTRLLENFLFGICKAEGGWEMAAFANEAIDKIRREVGEDGVVLGLSGGVDSSVAAVLLHQAIGDRLTCIFVDNGLLRAGEAESVERTFRNHFKVDLHVVDAKDRFLSALAGEADPEKKRKIIGRVFIEVFEAEAKSLPHKKFLAQGTLYPDVIESVSPSGGPSTTLKTHHNVGGLPARLGFELIEPLRELFKDEVRALGRRLGLPDHILQRHPFPGPGLAVRCLGAIEQESLDILREADRIAREELEGSGYMQRTSQAFVVLLPVRSVGVMGDHRTYERVAALRVVETEDFMTADWADLPRALLARISSRIINEVAGINRVVYDISSKPPATIEWE
jgi:GMP synthase (glutamine-hydrolysing)